MEFCAASTAVVEDCDEVVRRFLILVMNLMNLYKKAISGDHLGKEGIDVRIVCLVARRASLTSVSQRVS